MGPGKQLEPLKTSISHRFLLKGHPQISLGSLPGTQIKQKVHWDHSFEMLWKQNIPATQKERLLALEWSALHYFLLGSHITHIISIKAPQPWAWGKDHFKYCVATFSHPEWMTRCWPKGLFHGKPSQKTNKWEDLPFPFGKMSKWWKAAPRMLELKGAATRPPENLSYTTLGRNSCLHVEVRFASV